MNLYNNYKLIWHCNNKSRNIRRMKKTIKSYLNGKPLQYDNAGNMYIGDFTKPKPCLVAHLDSVHDKVGEVTILSGDILTSTGGIGGDDKCGLVACLEARKYCDINILFTVDEEVGGIGAGQVNKKLLENVMYFIEIDRKGHGDLITNLVYGVKSISEPMLYKLKPFMQGFGFKETDGLYTDLCDILPEVKKCGMNISAGYYQPHTNKGYVVLSELQNTINFVIEVCNNIRESFELEIKEFVWLEDDYTLVPDGELNDDFLIGDLHTINSLEELREYVLCLKDGYALNELINTAYDLGYKDREADLVFDLEFADNDLKLTRRV